MALTDGTEGGMVMPVTPMNNNGGFGFGGDGLWILILFFLLCGNGGWGGNGGMNGLYPWMNNSQNINDGFRDQMLSSQLNGITGSINAGFSGITGQLYNSQLADLERSFAAQTASTAGMTNISSQLANCCCENRASIADLKYTVATEACADRNAVASALRDVLTATQAQTQTILDKMCAQEIDNLKQQNIALQNQVNMQALAASQTAQTAALVADNTAQTQYIVNRVAPYPIPAYTVANPTTPAVA